MTQITEISPSSMNKVVDECINEMLPLTDHSEKELSQYVETLTPTDLLILRAIIEDKATKLLTEIAKRHKNELVSQRFGKFLKIPDEILEIVNHHTLTINRKIIGLWIYDSEDDFGASLEWDKGFKKYIGIDDLRAQLELIRTCYDYGY